MEQQLIAHALGLHMHQPPGNLKLLIEQSPWEAEQIIRCYERVPRYAREYRDIASLHVGFSGILLEQLLDPGIVDAYRHIVDIPAMLENYRNSPNIELIGMGYYHPIFPLIPQQDWGDQLSRGRAIMDRIFGRPPQGFWPPEMAFSMEMVPALVEAGYRFVVVDGVHIQPLAGELDIYQPYTACYEDSSITVVPRDRDLSNAQESGLDPAWFANEVQRKVWHSPQPHEPRLITTWSDGENGGWFRQTDEDSGFFGYFFAPYMEHARHGEYPARTVTISSYLQTVQLRQQAQVRTGAWNVGDTSGEDLSQWAGSDNQRQAVAEINRISNRYHQLAAKTPTGAEELLQQAHREILEAQTSCFLFWGDNWLPHLFRRTRRVRELLENAALQMGQRARRKAGESTTPGAKMVRPRKVQEAARKTTGRAPSKSKNNVKKQR